MYGVGDPARWATDPARVGFGMIRVTDIIERAYEDLESDPEDKFGEVRRKLDAYHAAGLTALLDLSFVRNLAERHIPDDRFSNVYDHYDTHQGYRQAIALAQKTGVWGHPALRVIAIAGEPEGPNWGIGKRYPKSHQHLMQFYKDVATTIRRAGWDGPITSGGVMHFDGGSGLNFADLAAQDWNTIPTVHLYNESDLRFLPEAARICQGLGKPLWVEEFGVEVKEQASAFAQATSDEERSRVFGEWMALTTSIGVSGNGLWNLGDGGGHTVQIGRDTASQQVLQWWTTHGHVEPLTGPQRAFETYGGWSVQEPAFNTLGRFNPDMTIPTGRDNEWILRYRLDRAMYETLTAAGKTRDEALHLAMSCPSWSGMFNTNQRGWWDFELTVPDEPDLELVAMLWPEQNGVWPDSEVNILEGHVATDTWMTNLHWKTSSGEEHGQTPDTSSWNARGLHRYSTHITGDRIDFYYDGRLVRSIPFTPETDPLRNKVHFVIQGGVNKNLGTWWTPDKPLWQADLRFRLLRTPTLGG